MHGIDKTFTLQATCQEAFEIVTDYQRYPSFFSEFQAVSIIQKNDNDIIVEYHIKLIKDISYRLCNHLDPANFSVQWKLLESKMLTHLTGGWAFTHVDDNKINARYQTELELNIPVPKLMVSKLTNMLVEGTLSGVIQNLQKEVYKRRKA